MIKANKTEDQNLLEGIRNADPQQIKMVYDQALPSVIAWVLENNGSVADARDIFQEALIALFRKLEQGDFTLTCTLKSYLRILCRNLWLTRLRDRKKMIATPLNAIEEVHLDQEMEKRLEESEREQLFFAHFDLLGDKCREILQWFFDRVPLSQIAERLNTSEAYIKKKKFLCKEKLVKSIQNDPSFKELSQ